MEGDDGDDLLVVVPQSFHHSRGDEGAGPGDNDGVCYCPLQSSTMTGGQDGTYVPPIPATSTGASVKPTHRPLRIHPPYYACTGDIEGGRCATHTPPPFQFIYPCWGDFLRRFVDRGQRKSQMPPPSTSFIPPYWGEYLF